MDGSKGSKRRKKALKHFMKDQRLYSRLQKYVGDYAKTGRSFRVDPMPYFDQSMIYMPYRSLDNSDSSEVDDTDVGDTSENTQYANVANKRLREIYARSADALAATNRSEKGGVKNIITLSDSSTSAAEPDIDQTKHKGKREDNKVKKKSKRKESEEVEEISSQQSYLNFVTPLKKRREDNKVRKRPKRKESEDMEEVSSLQPCVNAVTQSDSTSQTAPNPSTSVAEPDADLVKSKRREKSKRKESEKMEEISLQQSYINFSDVGGLNDTLKEISLLLLHLKQPDVYKQIGVKSPPRGFLLHGPPGCGKTLIAHAIAGELQLPFIKVAATELVSGVSGESESKIRELFERATLSAPCILFIDEIDAITPKREMAQREMEKRIVTQLLKCMDDLSLKDASAQVMVIGATNRPQSLDPAVRRAGRFDREISIGIPDEATRLQILKVICGNLRLAHDFDLQWLARNTPGYVGADLMAVTREAAVIAVNRVFESLLESEESESCRDGANSSNKGPAASLETVLTWLKEKPPIAEGQWENVFVTTSDFEAALKVYVPSAKREGFATVPNVTWEDVGALKSVKEALQKAILWPIKYKKEFEEFNLTAPTGVLLCGPKGCGKTLLAKAVANECSINFLSVKGPELLNMYVGESERAVRECFQRAKNSAPCVIFFDEIDALCPQRSSTNENAAAERVVNQLLTEIDGIEGQKQIFVMGATNRPDNIDSAMLRPGRLEKVIFVGVPDKKDRLDILGTITKNGTKPKLAEGVSLDDLASDFRCEGFSGADLCSLVREASFKALEDYILKQNVGGSGSFAIQKSHFEFAFANVVPSISERDKIFFNSFGQQTLNRCDSQK